MTVFLLAGLFAAVIAAILGVCFISIGKRLGLVDAPFVESRKVHTKPIPLVGGYAIVSAIAAALVLCGILWPDFVPQLSTKKWVALGLAATILFVFGFVDDRFKLPARIQIWGPIIASVLVILSGIVVGKVTNPFGGIISFSAVPVVAILITFCWLMGMMYSTKLLDGLDGLSTGLSGIAGVVIFALTQTARYYEPRVGFAAIIFAGACFGFLVVNFNPARAFLGEGGSLFLGFVIAILSILSGSKIAIALIVMGLPVFDVARVMLSRKLRGAPVFEGDNQHLHHLMLSYGLSQRAAVLLYYIVGLSLGIAALFLQSRGKILLLGGLVVLGFVLVYIFRRPRARI